MLGLGLNIAKSPLVESYTFTDPTSIPGLQSWWKYKYGYRNSSGTLKDITTTWATDDTNLSQWDDQVSGNHLVQITANDQPRFVLADYSVNFKNNAKFWDITTHFVLTDYTINVVCKFDNTIVNRTFFAGDDPPFDGVPDDLIRIVSSTQINFKYAGISLIINGLTTLAINTYYVFTFIREGATTTVYVNGVKWGFVIEMTPVNIFYISHAGSNDPESQTYKGQWKDATVYNRALTPTEITDMNTYLQAL